MRFNRGLGPILVLASASGALANESPEQPSTAGPRAFDRGRFTLDLANDDFGSDRDEAFTSGVEAILRFVPGDNVSLANLHPFLRENKVQEYWGFLIGHQMYTPALLTEIDLEVLKNDRRFAGWVYLSLQAELAIAGSLLNRDGYTFLRARITTGATGPQTHTDVLQRYWHAFLRDVLNRRFLPEDPKGWPVYQVPDHWGVNLRVDYESEAFRWQAGWANLVNSIGSDLSFRVSTLAQLRLGNVWIDGHVGAAVRFGLMPELTFDDLGFMVESPKQARPDLPFSIYGFASARLIGSIYDAFLDGPPNATGPYPARNHGLTQLEAGFAIRFAPVEFMFRHTTLSPQLESPPPSGVWIQNWGRFTINFIFE